MKTYLSNKGLRPDIDNSGIINKVIESAKEKTWLVFPNGNFPVNQSLIQNNKGLYWDGAEDTNLLFNHPGVGLQLTRNANTNRTVICGVNFLGRFNGQATAQHGIISNVPIRIEDIIIENFHGDGLQLTADINTQPKTDVSFSYCAHVTIRSCDGNGIYIQGGDSNAGTFIHCDVRDCGGIAIWDSSFLGNNFYSCMTHNNKGGSFRADDLNSRSNFFGCYCEDGQPPVYLGAHACWFGGLPSSGIQVTGEAKVFSYPSVNIIK